MVEFGSGKGGEVAEGRAEEKALPMLEEVGAMPDLVGKIVVLELETG